MGILKYIKEQFTPRNRSEENTSIGSIGLLATLIGIWVPAVYMDWGTSDAGGVSIFAMFGCSPIALFVGPIVGIVGSRISSALAKRALGESIGTRWTYRIIGAGIAGLLAGVSPYALLLLFAEV